MNYYPLRFLQRGTDSVPAALTPKEAVLNRNAAELAGRQHIARLNAMGNMLARRGVDLAGRSGYQYGASNMTGADNPLAMLMARRGYQDGTDNVGSTGFDLLTGALAGHEATFAAAGQKYGIDPKLLMAISLFETGGGNSHMVRTLNNVAGITNPGGGGYRQFGSIPESIDYMASNLKRNYFDKGLTTISDIGAKYAPVGASNDPNKTNSQWPAGVSNIYNRLSGSPDLSAPSLTGLPRTRYPTDVRPPVGGAYGSATPYAQVPGGPTQVPTDWVYRQDVGGYVPRAEFVAKSEQPTDFQSSLASGVVGVGSKIGEAIQQAAAAQQQRALSAMASARGAVPTSISVQDPWAALRAAGLI